MPAKTSGDKGRHRRGQQNEGGTHPVISPSFDSTAWPGRSAIDALEYKKAHEDGKRKSRERA